MQKCQCYQVFYFYFLIFMCKKKFLEVKVASCMSTRWQCCLSELSHSRWRRRCLNTSCSLLCIQSCLAMFSFLHEMVIINKYRQIFWKEPLMSCHILFWCVWNFCRVVVLQQVWPVYVFVFMFMVWISRIHGREKSVRRKKMQLLWSRWVL